MTTGRLAENVQVCGRATQSPNVYMAEHDRHRVVLAFTRVACGVLIAGCRCVPMLAGWGCSASPGAEGPVWQD